MKKLIIGTVILLLAVGGGGYLYWQSQTGSRTVLKMEAITKGRLIATVGSTGTLQPREIVDVGAQVVGRIIYIGKDKKTKSGIVDWGSEVQGPEVDKDGKIIKLGTILAKIDPLLYQAQVNSTTAAVQAAEADVEVKTAILFQATRDWGRAVQLLPSGGIAQAEHVGIVVGVAASVAITLLPTGGIAQAEHDQLRATFLAAQASLALSKANVAVAEANLFNAQTNLDYTTISAPVNGIIIDRRVNPGQTVVASLSAPSLFLLAKDLSKMEVWATVNEVDVGKIQKYQDVDFTVDSNPGRLYKGKVVPQGDLPLRLNATMNSNVVTYTVVVSVDNEDLALRPYQTANLSFIVQHKEDAVLVPNAALRWQPSTKQIDPDLRDAYAELKNKKRTATDPESVDRGIIWTMADDDVHVRFLEIRTGLGDGVKTEVVDVIAGGELPRTVVVGEARANSREAGANPFSSPLFKPKPKE